MSLIAASSTRLSARWIVLGAALASAGCSTLGLAPVSRPSSTTQVPDSASSAPTETRAQSDASGASSALLAQSQTERAAGRLSAASASAERALRIDPNNPAVWLELGEVELAMGDAAQAATMARKALTLAGGDPALEERAERLLRAASR